MSRRRVLVATDRAFPAAALESAVSLAGAEGEVVLASVVVVPHAQPLDASLEPSGGRRLCRARRR